MVRCSNEKKIHFFGTKHTTFNSVDKQAYTDPIKKQKKILFHKWLDRHIHRHMWENLNNKEEMLNKLNEKCNM